ncbi:MAG: preprotein translocase subunit SecG [Planctomycetota bacterium]|nr:preprotein translocase subunit SecG [Planctomycetota bacterium]
MILPFAVFQLSQYVFGPLLFILSTFIILLILLQRGRGGGLTGALGGAGGSSAFGVKAGDILTRITAFSVLGWIVLCAFVCWFYLPAQLDIETTTFGAGSLSIESDDAKTLNSDLPTDAGTLTPSATLPAAGLKNSESQNPILPAVVPSVAPESK